MSALIDFFYITETIIPVWQILLLLLLSTLALLFGRIKLSLLINYIFTLNWGYISNQKLLFENVEHVEYVAAIYFGAGVILAISAAAGFFIQKE